ncbi:MULTISPECIES: hypothetical protein [Pseudoalteromonas]|jgi:hypothetical protein|uniref:Uncharacterized protein n=1 Tax=Pseudoalteromonas lipolytica TaxID=570156 RepID=A0AAD0WCJ4_9GAMM|nr:MULTISPECIES: hypothetical protein [Pseudoalteromonas]MDX1353276.1 hypothetical protein [Thiomicrorhabdus sp.]AXV65350.1 hypothetical protein D0907_08725 [Pseudoalteromonas donghaensis]EWH07076.1 hypothetical protein AT00_05085 [Pseudoalteromonas lipolytica SCSIO 04301]MCC9659679.1 hypothetical protein [Pseudoalteromonas sp. MB41]QLJ06892.1 hypothetical protein GZH31_08595 [Pseudoalteromonas sp. JSTW]|tara:strand:+ start:92 stop:493 length:402 start_codon:yes stop_codon:yes gene_type:complete
MSTSESSSTFKHLIKHILLWSVFSYFYHSGVNVLVAMAHDAKPEHGLLTSIAYGIGFNVLVGHLIGKYDKHWPVIAALYIASVGLLIVPLVILGKAGLMDVYFIVAMILSLPTSTFVIEKIKQRISLNTEQTQ